MPHPGRYAIEPHRPLTAASRDSHLEIERCDGCYSYRLSLSSTPGPARVVCPGSPIFSALFQLDSLIDFVPRNRAEAEETARLERELHEDVIAFESELIERENARLFALP